MLVGRGAPCELDREHVRIERAGGRLDPRARLVLGEPVDPVLDERHELRALLDPGPQRSASGTALSASQVATSLARRHQPHHHGEPLHISRATPPWGRRTPFAARLIGRVNCVRLNGSAPASGVVAGPVARAPRDRRPAQPRDPPSARITSSPGRVTGSATYSCDVIHGSRRPFSGRSALRRTRPAAPAPRLPRGAPGSAAKAP